MPGAVVFMSYSHKDELLRDRLAVHLTMLVRQGLIEAWHDRRITPGNELDPAISAEIERADLFLFLVSIDFIHSNYCYEVEMTRALERQAEGKAKVLPVILRSCEWHQTPLGCFLAVPRDGYPVVKFAHEDDAFTEVAGAVRRIVGEIVSEAGTGTRPLSPPLTQSLRREEPRATTPSAAHPRSSNLALPKRVSDAERDAFLEKGFEFVLRFFEESGAELMRRSPDAEVRIRQVDAESFVARAYRSGKQEAACRIFMGSSLGRGIAFSYNADANGNSLNDQITVAQDAYGPHFKVMGMSMHGQRNEGGVSAQGAAEHFWGLFIKRLQG